MNAHRLAKESQKMKVLESVGTTYLLLVTVALSHSCTKIEH